MIVCWTVKGGSGVSVTAALIARVIAEQGTAVLADLAGDQPALLGFEERPVPGFKQWAEASAHAPDDSLSRLAVAGADDVHLIGTGVTGPAEVSAAVAGVAGVRVWQSASVDVVDAGCITPQSRLAASVVSKAPESWLVIRPCFLALSRAVASPLAPTKVIVIEEPGRSLDHRDVEAVLGVEDVAVLKWDNSLARAVDAGRLASYKGRNLAVLRSLVSECEMLKRQLSPASGGVLFPKDAA